MGLIKKEKRKHISFFIFVGLLLWGVFSVAYIYRYRKMHIASSNSYKNDIVELQKKTEGLEGRVLDLEEIESTLLKDLEALKTDIVSQSEYITDGASQDYIFRVDLDDVSLNEAPLNIAKAGTFSRLLVAGHIYGSPHAEDRNSIPAQTLIDALPLLGELQPDLFISLGDMVYVPSEQAFKKLDEAFLSQITFPLINAPGNHDLSEGRGLYESHFGQTFFYAKYLTSQVVILDTELANCYVVGRQKKMLREAIEVALHDEDIDYIFVFLHKLIFLDQSPSLRGETNGNCYFRTNYDDIREEILLPAALEKPVYLVAGDVGAFGGNLSPFYAQDGENQFYTIAVGLGNAAEDALLQIDFYPEKPEFQLISLAEKEFLPLENYTPEYWSENE